MKHSRAAILRQTSTLLAVSLAALALSSCGVFHHSKKPAKKKLQNKHQVEHKEPVATSAEPPKMPEPLPHSDPAEISDKIPPLPKEDPKPSTYPTAKPVPGKPGRVISPFNSLEIDVEGIESGKLVSDPTYPTSAKKYFRVP